MLQVGNAKSQKKSGKKNKPAVNAESDSLSSFEQLAKAFPLLGQTEPEVTLAQKEPSAIQLIDESQFIGSTSTADTSSLIEIGPAPGFRAEAAIAEAMDNSRLSRPAAFTNIAINDNSTVADTADVLPGLADQNEQSDLTTEESEPPVAEAVIDPAKAGSIGELLSFISPEAEAKPQHHAELLGALDLDELKSMVALYHVTYSGKDNAAAEKAATELIDRVVSGAKHQSAMKIAEQHKRDLLVLAQTVQRVFNTDVVVKALTADQFANAALESINTNSILRSAICELGRSFKHPGIPTKPDLASVNTLVSVVMQAAAHMHTIPGFRDRTQTAVYRLGEEVAHKDAEIARLTAKLDRKVSDDLLAIEVAVRTARVFPDKADIPRSLLVSDGSKRFLCYVDKDRRPVLLKKQPTKLRLANVGWTTNMARAIGFLNQSEAVKFVEQILLLETHRSPTWTSDKGLHVRGVSTSNLHFARLAAIFAEKV